MDISKLFRFILLAIVLTGTPLLLQAQAPADYTMVWNDEFNGTTLDASKWKPAPEWPRQGGSYWSDDNYEMTGSGQVKLKVTEQNGTVYCGAIRTHNLFDKKYGYFETRCKLPQIRGGWAAFWLMPYGNHPGGWGHDGTEMDVFESINGWNGKINHALHWDGYGAEHQKSSLSTSRPELYDDQYHVFAMLWTPQEYVFYIDNQESWRTSAGGVSDVSQYLKLTMEVSSGTWAGNWSDQQTKPIDWLVDYVRVYEHQPNSTVSLDYHLLQDNQTFDVGDQVEMHVDVSGSLSLLDELRFTTKKAAENEVLRKTSPITSESTYWYNWFPSEAGNYNLKVAGYKNGAYVTQVEVDATVQSTVVPLSMSFQALTSGDVFSVNDFVPMDVLLTGSLSDADEIQFLAKRDTGDFVLEHSATISSATSYSYAWSPPAGGVYSLRATSIKNGNYVTHTVVGAIEVQDPLTLSYTILQEGDIYHIGDEVKMHVAVSGDLTEADEIRFLVQKDGENSLLDKQVSMSLSQTTYWNKWVPTEIGNYLLKAKAYHNGSFVTSTLANVTIQHSPLGNSQAGPSIFKDGSAYTVYPNPTTGTIHLSKSEEYLVIDANGKAVTQGVSDVIDLSQQSEGVYSIHIGSQVLKVVKQ